MIYTSKFDEITLLFNHNASTHDKAWIVQQTYVRVVYGETRLTHWTLWLLTCWLLRTSKTFVSCPCTKKVVRSTLLGQCMGAAMAAKVREQRQSLELSREIREHDRKQEKSMGKERERGIAYLVLVAFELFLRQEVHVGWQSLLYWLADRASARYILPC